MTSRMIRILILLTAICISACCPKDRSALDSTRTADTDQTRPSLGYLEHRGKQYEIRDLMNPAYRAACDDEFVQKFNFDTVYAGRSHTE